MTIIRLDNCPAWCGGHDDDYALPPGIAEEHVGGGDGQHLREIRNVHGSYVSREDSGSWHLYAREQVRLDNCQMTPLVELTVDDGAEGTTLAMTTGEARVLAAHLLRYADRVDFRI
jgi:hypothetical protein